MTRPTEPRARRRARFGWASLALLVCLALAGVAAATAPAQAARPRPPVVMLVLDELPTNSLLDANGRIDAARYPNFAALAGQSTWYPNAAAVYDQTFLAVPALLDAKRPRPGVPFTYRGHPHNLFTLLARDGYHVHASEPITSLCPPRVCHGAAGPKGLSLIQGDRAGAFRSYTQSIHSEQGPALWFRHELLPHNPYVYLPSGERFRDLVHEPLPRLGRPPGFRNAGLQAHFQQRHLLQLEFTDRLLGEWIARLRQTGIFDRALVVVTADHGVSFSLGPNRRKVSRANIQDIAPVPLFIKRPGVGGTAPDRTIVRATDVVPTMARLLSLKLNWHADGHSAFSAVTRRRRTVRMPRRDLKQTFSISLRRLQAGRRRSVARRIHLLGSGPTGLDGAGPRRGLDGVPVSAFTVKRARRVRVRLAGSGGRPLLSPGAGFVPALVEGTLEGGRARPGRILVVAVNGVVVSSARTAVVRPSRREQFAAMVPRSALRSGRNRIQVFALGRGARSLTALPGAKRR